LERLRRERERLWPERGSTLTPSRWIAGGAAVVLAIVYAPLVAELVRAWRTDEYAGHGMFVPVYSAFLLWMDRERFRTIPRRIEPAGALLLVLALALFAASRSAGVLSVQVVSLALAMAGAVLWALGPHVLRAAAFPVGFLVLMMPLPRPVVSAVSLPLQAFAARFASAVLGLFGVPHHQHGIFIDLPNLSLMVFEGCNGLRFLMALVTLTAAFAQATQRTAAHKLILVAAAVPVALLANDVRVASLALAGHYIGPHAAAGLTHNSIGKGVWALAMVPLALLGIGLRRRRSH
jgi:exosortase